MATIWLRAYPDWVNENTFRPCWDYAKADDPGDGTGPGRLMVQLLDALHRMRENENLLGRKVLLTVPMAKEDADGPQEEKFWRLAFVDPQGGDAMHEMVDENSVLWFEQAGWSGDEWRDWYEKIGQGNVPGRAVKSPR